MTVFRATAARDGRFWSVTIHDLPENTAGFTQGRNWTEAEEMARDAIAGLLDVPADSFDIRLAPEDEEAAQAIEAARQAREAAERAEAAKQRSLQDAALVLTRKGFTVRDAGRALGISYQRVSQLTRDDDHRAGEAA
ncbi:type II toxin-antitoxin system HicB family antitoxin [Nocardiopsis potens]|uniref:type II toxin-antitoxin system HicB family antitoxin n=1 Tax=Nocardiopsis potens TaxID=1246458 RepID=UPI0003448AAA|nr:hypothetical protein [Nocardiopsis potens]